MIQKLHMPMFGGVTDSDPDPGFLENPDPDPGLLKKPDPDPGLLKKPDPDPGFPENLDLDAVTGSEQDVLEQISRRKSE